VGGRGGRVERARDEAEHEREEGGDAAEDGHDPGDEVAAAPVEPRRERGVAGEDQEPEEQRALLAAPERRQRVAERQRAARVLRHVDEGEVAARERAPEDGGGDGGRRERGEEGVPRGQGEAAAALPGGERAGDERVRDEPQAQKERCAAERGHVRTTSSASPGCTSTGTSSRASP